MLVDVLSTQLQYGCGVGYDGRQPSMRDLELVGFKADALPVSVPLLSVHDHQLCCIEVRRPGA